MKKANILKERYSLKCVPLVRRWKRHRLSMPESK
jgi:hypothetical protein